MGESDPNNPKVNGNGESLLKWAIREAKGVGIAAVILAFGMYEWHTIVKELQGTMAEVRLLLIEVKHELKKGP